MMQHYSIKEDTLAIALETSGRLGSVAIGIGGSLSGQKTFSGPMRHSIELFDTIGDLLQKNNKKAAQIDHIYISTGPGSFTGVRISVAVAKAMAFANNAKIVAVPTSEAMAKNAENQKINKVATIIDAKRGQFFVAVFKKNSENPLWQKIIPDCLMTTTEFIEKFNTEDIYLLGEGLLYYKEKFKTDKIKIMEEKFWSPRAENIFDLGTAMAREDKFSDPLTLEPLYLRKPEAQISWEKKQNTD